MPTYTATTGADALTGASGDDVFVFDSDTVQSGDTFDAGDGLDTLQVDLLGVLYNFSLATVSHFEALRFSGSGGLGFVQATFSANEFGGAGISTALAVTGSALAQDLIEVNLTSGATFSAADWTFTGWIASADLIAINGSSGADIIIGSSQRDQISAGDGDDVVIAGQGGGATQFVDGGAGVDTVSYAQLSTSAITVSLASQGTNQDTGGAGTQRLFGFENISGSAFGDTLTGDNNANVIEGTGGVDTLSGLDGDDTLGVSGSIASLSAGGVDGGLGTDTLRLNAGSFNAQYLQSWTLTSIERLSLSGFGSGYFFSPGQLAANLAVDATNAISNYANIQIFRNSTAGPVNVDISGWTFTNWNGNIYLYGDASSGDATNSIDILTGSSQADQIYGYAGADILTGNGGGDYIDGMDGNDVINGGVGADTLFGSEGNDTLDGGADADEMYGGNGDDIYYVDNSSDAVNELGTGTDTVYVAISGYTLMAGIEIGRINAGGGLTLTGNALNNTLYGNAGNDTLAGGAGIDTATYALASTAASWHRSPDGTWTVTTGPGGMDTLIGVERLDFTDRDVVLDPAQENFYGNGASDIVWRHGPSGTVVIWEVQGATQTSAAVAGGAPDIWEIVGTGDFDADGHDDFLWRNTVDGGVAAWLQNGATSNAQAMIGGAPLNWEIAGIGDFNADGHDDLVWRNTLDGGVAVWLQNGLTSISQNMIGGAPLDWAIVGVADFDGDGRDDILLRNTVDGALARWTTDGTGPAATNAAIVGWRPPAWDVAATGDFDGDGRADILWRNHNDGAAAIWLVDGDTRLASGGIGAAPTDWSIVQVGDYNGDGRDDILWRHDSDGLLAFWTTNGLTVESQVQYGFVPPDWRVV